jgi:hypothetical protein
MMADNQTTTDEVEIEVLYTHGAHSKGVEFDEDGEAFELARDLRGFGTDAFDDFDRDPQHALDTAYDTLFEFTVDAELDDVHDAGDLLGELYDRMQGPRTDEQIGYDGSETRSLGVGDVIVVDGQPFMVDRIGFTDMAARYHVEYDDSDDSDDDRELVADGGVDEEQAEAAFDVDAGEWVEIDTALGKFLQYVDDPEHFGTDTPKPSVTLHGDGFEYDTDEYRPLTVTVEKHVKHGYASKSVSYDVVASVGQANDAADGYEYERVAVESLRVHDDDPRDQLATDGGHDYADDTAAEFEEVAGDDAEHVSAIDASRECAMCGSETSRSSRPYYFKWHGELRISEDWSCGDCGLQGTILRRRSDGEIVRMSHLHTGSGFEYPRHDAEEQAGGTTLLTPIDEEE